MVEPSAGLFENRREATIQSTTAMVEDVLIALGHFVNECRADTPDVIRGWRMVKGSASIRITLIDSDQPGALPYLRVVAPVLTTDARVDIGKLYRRLLTLNFREVKGVAFAAQQNEILLVSERSTLDLDRSEVDDLIGRVAEYADKYDNVLVDEFGGRLGGIE